MNSSLCHTSLTNTTTADDDDNNDGDAWLCQIFHIPFFFFIIFLHRVSFGISHQDVAKKCCSNNQRRVSQCCKSIIREYFRFVLLCVVVVMAVDVKEVLHLLTSVI